MQATDAERTIRLALEQAELKPEQRPRILTDNGSAYVSHHLREYLKGEHIDHVRGAPLHPMTQPGGFL
ncbi:integrase catalytic domain-containing protein [Telluribacter humicola]|uniref:integrase catalytic domain-containing protein n=1 Tax=Telluribacter humicola TaxID=1720261 RepID=UPI001A96F0C7|nr:hypothetical protein [Telluribacter humicola]